ncbi:hypothetical protein CBER1_00711 [Cercospora berteroae]|uniref:Thioredoxin domain-containing protein n=1 Tax=Cercospora berteroae TaxID=357750 RepID=A0A2S6C972_9PEZI|nr:hypothetical protein CBER1_00711 [Cercospora berteroae]
MAAGSQVHGVDTEQAFNNAIAELPGTTLAVIYFHAPWAEPCKQMSTILTTLASTYEPTTPLRIAFLSLDAEELSDVSERYDVTQVPLVVLQKDGKVLEQITGTDANRVRTAVERHSGGDGKGAGGLPPKQSVTRQEQDRDTAMGGTSASNGDLSQYKPGANEQQTAPQSTEGHVNGEQSKEDLNKRLGELVKAAPVMLFMKGTPSAPQCGFSRQTVSILREKGVRYGFFNILADDEVRQGLKEFSDWPTFPQVYCDGELVGGLDILKEEFESNPEFMQEYAVKKGGPGVTA